MREDGTTVVDTAWHHYAYVKRLNSHQIYLDGVLELEVDDYDLSPVVPTAMVVYATLFPASAALTWTEPTLPSTSNSLYTRDVAWSPSLSLFVGVGHRTSGVDRFLTSPDGVTWTQRNAPAANTYRGVAWSPSLSLLVAVALDGTDRVATSPDGVTWTPRTAASAADWRAVAWAPSLALFVAVGTNVVMTSTDGIAWTSRTSAANKQWNSVCWSPGLSLFVAVASTSGTASVMTSPDGVNWTSRSHPSVAFFGGPVGGSSIVAWSPSLALFAAAARTNAPSAGDYQILTSPDGTTWTARTIPTGGLRQPGAVVWADTQFIAQENGDNYYTSPDGITWTLGTQPFSRTWDVTCWSPDLGVYLACAQGSDFALRGTLTAAQQCALTGVKMWNAALTDAEIADEMADYPAVRTGNLYLESHLASAADLTDSSGDGHDWIVDVIDPQTPVDVASGPNGAMTSSVGSKLTAGPYTPGTLTLSITEDLPPDFARFFTMMGWWKVPGATPLPFETGFFRAANDNEAGGTAEIQFNLTVDRTLYLSAANGTAVGPTVTIAASPEQPEAPVPSTVTLTATVTHDDTYAPSTYAWTQVSGPGSPMVEATIASPTADETDVTFETYVPGTYVFQLVVEGTNTFDDSAFGPIGQTITLILAAAQAPRVESGNAQTTYPTGVTLAPEITDDGWSGALTYAWTQVSGPDTATIVSASADETDVTFPETPGAYLFALTVTSDGFTGTGYWRVTVFTSTAPSVPADVADVVITVNGVSYCALIESPTINEVLDAAPNTASFRVYSVPVSEGADVILEHGSAGRLFAGTAMAVTQSLVLPAHQFFDVRLNGYEWQMARRKVSKAYIKQSISSIAADLVAMVPGFTGGGIQTGLPSVTIAFTRQTIPAALSQLAARLTDGRWKVDYFKDVSLGTVDTANDDPEPITVTYGALHQWHSTRDLSQVVTRLRVTGQSPAVIKDEVSLAEIEVDSLDDYSSAGGFGELNGEIFTYTGTAKRLVGSLYTPEGGVNVGSVSLHQVPVTDPSGHLALTQGYFYGFTLTSPDGETPQMGGGSAIYLAGTENAFALTVKALIIPTQVKRVTAVNLYRLCHSATGGDGRLHLVASVPLSTGLLDTVLLDTLSDADELLTRPEIPSLDTSGRIGYFLTGVVGLTSATKVKDPVKYVFTLNDTAAQAALSTLLGGSDDGVIEDDLDVGTMLRADAEAFARTYLTQRAEVEVSVSPVTKDWRMRPGRTLTVNLTDARNVVGDFTIRSTAISGFAAGSPWYAATATTTLPLVRFEQLLRR